MKITSLAVVAAALAASSLPASAQVAGRWRVTGKVSSFAFMLNCDFKPEGHRLGGVCVDASTNSAKIKGGKSHTLTSGNVSGDKVIWTYRSSFLFTNFDVIYNGEVAGDTMSGVIDAQGHKGSFTATRG